MTARRSIVVLAPAVAFSVVTAVPASSAELATDRYTRDCRHEVGGARLLVRLTVQFASAGSNDIKKISVRSSDDGEKGAFRTTAAQLSSGLVKINGPDDQKTTLNKSFTTSNYSTNVGPRSNGKDAARVTTIVTWNLPKKRKASLTCFYIDG